MDRSIKYTHEYAKNGISCVAPFRQTLNFTPTRRAKQVAENPSADGSNARCRHTTTTLALVCPAHSPTYILDHTRPLRACAKMACSHVQWAEQATRSTNSSHGPQDPTSPAARVVAGAEWHEAGEAKLHTQYAL